ncbi:GNAT family N-acetyltransferase [Thiohalobacter sp. IOR34]|uniref:GNAT family N-acetyltransferase n=1 Tax=Thiohalobacter sp. IOR34 TaxID=3057176 RepID=UPI0025B13B9D|nr:GNAT family N-acetyltransferase [Thiohalobacter sp. IOR34]WJW74403.1 GNAT family N-acetyltransferase [Thiohalobacter sp. IOR34]
MTGESAIADRQGFLVARADWSQDEAAIRRIRHQVFGEGFEGDGEEPDAACVHLLAYDLDGHPIAAARMQADGHIGQMAVIESWRGQGVGSALLRSLIELAIEHGLEQVRLSAGAEAAPFYHLHGFLPCGDPLEVAGRPRQPMFRYCSDPADPPQL